ncbi:MAG: hypothetical protein KIT73_18935 [Burkholderiales bacterium]|nr:hypothetical protein [Burkholderiales bacterium]
MTTVTVFDFLHRNTHTGQTERRTATTEILTQLGEKAIDGTAREVRIEDVTPEGYYLPAKGHVLS